MNRTSVLFAALCCVTASAAGDAQQVDETMVMEASRRIRNMPISEVTRNSLIPGREAEIIQNLRRRNTVSVLLRLRDKQTIQETLSRFAELEGKSPMLRRALVRDGRLASIRPWWLGGCACGRGGIRD
jgi:hypothetical protein